MLNRDRPALSGESPLRYAVMLSSIRAGNSGAGPSVLFCQLNKRLAVGVVDVADRGKLEAGEGSCVWQVGSVKIDVMESGCNESGRNENYANYGRNLSSYWSIVRFMQEKAIVYGGFEVRSGS